MSATLATDLQASVGWLLQDEQDLSIVADAARLDFAAALAPGVSADQADRLWHDRRTLAAGASEDLDLTSLVRSVFGGAVTVSLAAVKALLLVNSATTPGDDLALGGAGVAGQAWAGPFDGDPDARLLVPAGSAVLLSNLKAGWAVAAGTADILRMRNTGTGSVTYSLVLVGTSA